MRLGSLDVLDSLVGEGEEWRLFDWIGAIVIGRYGGGE